MGLILISIVYYPISPDVGTVGHILADQQLYNASIIQTAVLTIMNYFTDIIKQTSLYNHQSLIFFFSRLTWSCKWLTISAR